jgi:DNA-binding NarL/FixJ family response regulator
MDVTMANSTILHEAEAWGIPSGGVVAEPEAAPPPPQVKVLLVEDHVLFRTQLAKMICRDPRICVCGETDNAAEALVKVSETQPDLLIVDITLKGTNGLELIKELRSRSCESAVLVLSMHDESMYAERALRAGASGYITKHQPSSQLRDAMDRVLNGGVYLSTQMTTELLQKVAARQEDAAQAGRGVGSLSPREREIFEYIGKGFTTRDIASELQLGEKTVHSHRYQIKAKMGIRHTAELYTLAARWVEDQKNAREVGIARDCKLQHDEGLHDQSGGIA